MLGTGELAAIATAVFWAISAVFFTLAGRRIGSPAVNLLRLIMAFLLIAFVHLSREGTLFPWQTEMWRWNVLALSAFLGLAIGDAALFSAYVRIGPQLSMLVMTLTPVFSALAAWCCFSETIRPIEMMGIALTIAAIGWVVTERRDHLESAAAPGQATADVYAETARNPRNFAIGVILALVGSLGQTANLVVTKYALVDSYSTLSATQIRILIAAVCLVVWTFFTGKVHTYGPKIRDVTAMWLTAGGAIAGPILGIWLSYISIDHTRIGIASTIMATPPLLLIPLGAIFLEDRITMRSVMGTLVAIAGVATLFLDR